MITIMKYQMRYLKLTRKMFEEQKNLYQNALIHIRLEELQEKGACMVKCNKPTSSGTKITFRPVKNADEYQKELNKIVSDGEKLGIIFEKTGIT